MITYNRETRDYDVELDGEYLGSRRTHSAAEALLRQACADAIRLEAREVER